MSGMMIPVSEALDEKFKALREALKATAAKHGIRSFGVPIAYVLDLPGADKESEAALGRGRLKAPLGAAVHLHVDTSGGRAAFRVEWSP